MGHSVLQALQEEEKSTKTAFKRSTFFFVGRKKKKGSVFGFPTAGAPRAGAGKGPGPCRGRPIALRLKPLLRPVLGAAGGTMYAGRKRKKPVPKRWGRGGLGQVPPEGLGAGEGA